MADAPDSPDTPTETPDEFDSPAFAIGDVVHDRDDDTPNDAIVVNLPSKTADEWIAYRETTVADDNPDYPTDARVIVVGYAAELQRTFPDWDRESHLPLDQINESSVGHYSFPAPRLTIVESAESSGESPPSDDESTESDSASDEASATPADDDKEPDTALDSVTDTTESVEDGSEPDDAPATEADLSESMRALKARLEDGGMTVEIEPDGDALSVSKLGDIYRVRPGEVIEGEGALRGRLSSIVDEYA
jgi:hypothetical protein